MKNNKAILIRVPEKIARDFFKCCVLKDKKMSQVLREFIIKYVENSLN